jgi:1,4-dihydroxy-2-naphthoate octaprenyltransferase
LARLGYLGLPSSSGGLLLSVSIQASRYSGLATESLVMPAWRALARVGIKSSRPSQLLLIAGVYALGVKIALVNGGHATTTTLVAGLAALLPVAASVHYVNEYADYETDALTDRTPFSGGSGALQETGLPRTVTLWAGILALAAGTVLTALFLLTDTLTPVAAGLLAVIAVFGWQYSVPPLALVRHGVGELDNALLGGLVLPLYGGAVAGGRLTTVGLAVVPFTLVVFLNLLEVHWPDREADAAAGKRTLVVRWPPARLRATYAAVAATAALTLLALTPLGVWQNSPIPTPIPVPVALASVAVAPLVVWGWLGYTKRHLPWPSVAAMVGLAAVQFLAWCWVGL